MKYTLVLFIFVMSCSGIDIPIRSDYFTGPKYKQKAMDATFEILECVGISYDSLTWMYDDAIISTENFIGISNSRYWDTWGELYNHRLDRLDSSYVYENPFLVEIGLWDSTWNEVDSFWQYEHIGIDTSYIDSVQMAFEVDVGSYSFDTLNGEVYRNYGWVDVIEIVPRWYYEDVMSFSIGFGGAPYSYIENNGTATVYYPPELTVDSFRIEMQNKYCPIKNISTSIISIKDTL